MVTMAKVGASPFWFNFRKILDHRVTVLCVTALLAVYVVWQAGSLVWKLWLLDQEPSRAAALVPLPPANAEPESLQDLLRYPLIRSAANPATAGSAPLDRPKTSLNLKLVGLMYSTDQDQARAIIESEKDGARSYSTHERVADKAEIYSIEPDRVILLHAGRQETLMLDPEQNASGARRDDARQRGNGPDENRVSRQESGKVPKKTADLMREFSATPVMDQGELVGFRLQAVQNPEIMAAWGIDPDDVITAVNGIPLNSQGKVMVLYDKLKKQKEFELTLNNGGRSRTIMVDLSE
jgi:general secretion pathway protein C